jgi:WD40 repeat protein
MVGKFAYVACEDGSIRVLKVKKTKIELVKMLVKSSASCLSLAVASLVEAPTASNRKAHESSSDNEQEENIGPVRRLFAGYADGTIKMWDLVTGNCELHIEKQTQKEIKKDGPTLIWRLQKVGNYLVSGDSKGALSFWDCKFGTLVASFSQLQADILAI